MHLYILLQVALTALLCGHVEAWGYHGHRLVASLAKLHLSQEVGEYIDKVDETHFGGNMIDDASLPDKWDHSKKLSWTFPLHFVDLPDDSCSYNSTECIYDGHKNFCVVEAIKNYTRTIITDDEDDARKAFALIMTTHLVGDIHQPMHVAHTTDRGGNSIHVHFNGKKTNLHGLWDSDMLDYMLKTEFDDDFDRLLGYIQNRLMTEWSDQVQTWLACPNSNQDLCPSAWADESAHLSCKVAYNEVKDGDTVSMDYYKIHKDLMLQRIAQAALRLGKLLKLAVHPNGGFIVANRTDPFGPIDGDQDTSVTPHVPLPGFENDNASSEISSQTNHAHVLYLGAFLVATIIGMNLALRRMSPTMAEAQDQLPLLAPPSMRASSVSYHRVMLPRNRSTSSCTSSRPTSRLGTIYEAEE
eukprot:Clim_evm23s158 gene=Clim_evmTU23s158